MMLFAEVLGPPDSVVSTENGAPAAHAASVAPPLELVFLHGWALNRHVWRSVVARYHNRYRVINIDLPGHGRSPVRKDGRYDIDAVVADLAATIDSTSSSTVPRIVVAWSLGAMLALRLAVDYPTGIAGLVAVAGTGQFVADEAWPAGVDAAVFNQFANALVADYRSTIKRFLAIQSLGSPSAKEEIKTLSASLFLDGEPKTEALQGGLAILQKTRLQSSLAKATTCPSLFITGSNDTLVKPDASAATVKLMSRATLATVAGAGHAPFLSHPQLFYQLVDEFIADVADECAHDA